MSTSLSTVKTTVTETILPFAKILATNIVPIAKKVPQMVITSAIFNEVSKYLILPGVENSWVISLAQLVSRITSLGLILTGLAKFQGPVFSHSWSFSPRNVITNTINLYCLHNQFANYYFPGIVDSLSTSFLGKITLVALYGIGLIVLKKYQEQPAIEQLSAEELNQVQTNGYTRLTEACYWGDIKQVQALLAHKNINVNKVDQQGLTPLMRALYHKSPQEIVKLLLDHPKINLFFTDKAGKKAIHYAYVYWNVPTINQLFNPKGLSIVELDKKNSYVYTTNSSMLICVKSIVHLLLNPLYGVYVLAKEPFYLAINVTTTALTAIKNSADLFKTYGLITSSVLFVNSLIADITSSFSRSLWKIISLPLFILGMTLASTYGVFCPISGRNQINHLARVWNEEELIKLIGINKLEILSK